MDKEPAKETGKSKEERERGQNLWGSVSRRRIQLLFLIVFRSWIRWALQKCTLDLAICTWWFFQEIHLIDCATILKGKKVKTHRQFFRKVWLCIGAEKWSKHWRGTQNWEVLNFVLFVRRKLCRLLPLPLSNIPLLPHLSILDSSKVHHAHFCVQQLYGETTLGWLSGGKLAKIWEQIE